MNSTEKSILIVTQLFDVGGLETYIAGQVKSLIEDGWQVHLACGSECQQDFLPAGLSSFNSSFKFGADATFAELIQTVNLLSELIERKHIRYLHAHPFTSLFPSFLAAKIANISFIVTLHGPASLSSSYGTLNDFLLKAFILPNADMVLAVSEEIKLLAEPFCQTNALVLQPNLIDLTKFAQSAVKKGNKNKWLIISRLDIFKIVGIFEFIQLAQGSAINKIAIAGDGHAKDDLYNRLAANGLLENVEFLGRRNDISSLVHEFDGVAGMGRVFLESVASNKKTCLIGYDGVKGFLNDDLFNKAAKCNFSGRNLDNISNEEFARQLNQTDKTDYTSYNKLLKEKYNEKKGWHFLNLTLLKSTARPFELASKLYHILNSNYRQNITSYLYSYHFISDIGKLLNTSKYADDFSVRLYPLFLNLFNPEHILEHVGYQVRSITNSIDKKELLTAEWALKFENLTNEKYAALSSSADLNSKLVQLNTDNLLIKEEIAKVIIEKKSVTEKNIFLHEENNKYEIAKSELEEIIKNRDAVHYQLTLENQSLIEKDKLLQEEILKLESNAITNAREKDEIIQNLIGEKSLVSQRVESFEKRVADQNLNMKEKEEIIQNLQSQYSALVDQKTEEISLLTQNFENLKGQLTVQVVNKETELHGLFQKYSILLSENEITKDNMIELSKKNNEIVSHLNQILANKDKYSEEISLQLNTLSKQYSLINEQNETSMHILSDKVNTLVAYTNQLESQLTTIKRNKFYKVVKLFNGKEESKN